MIGLKLHLAMASVNLQALEQKLSSVRSVADIRQVLADEGVAMDDLAVAKGLLAQGALPRFAHLESTAQEQVAKLMLLAESNPEASQAIASSDVGRITAIASAAGITLDPEVTSLLAQPLDLDDAQLQQVVGGIDPLTASLITAGIGAIVTIATLWITRHYDTAVKIAEIEASKAQTV